MERTNQVNSVFLNGAVRSCDILSRDGGVTVASVLLYTLRPKPDAPPKVTSVEQCEQTAHRVRLVGKGGDASRIEELAQVCSRPFDAHERVYDFRGVLKEKDGNNYVECEADGFSRSKILEIANNNEAQMVGTVVATTHSDRFATVLVDAGGTTVRAQFAKDAFKDAWDSVARGKVKKGSTVSLKGPMDTGFITEGTKRLFRVSLAPVTMENLRLTQRKTAGPSL